MRGSKIYSHFRRWYETRGSIVLPIVMRMFQRFRIHPCFAFPSFFSNPFIRIGTFIARTVKPPDRYIFGPTPPPPARPLHAPPCEPRPLFLFFYFLLFFAPDSCCFFFLFIIFTSQFPRLLHRVRNPAVSNVFTDMYGDLTASTEDYSLREDRKRK